MRVLKIIFMGIVVFLIVSVIGIIIFLKTIDVNRFKSKITDQASASLGREVYIDQLSFDFSIRRGIILNIDGVRIANEPGAQPANLFEAKKVRLDLDLMAFIRERKILVSTVNVLSPYVLIVREASGEINLQKLAHDPVPKGSPAKSGAVVRPVSNQTSASANQEFLSALFIQNISVNEGRAVFIDKTFDPELKAEISLIDLAISDFSFNDRFEFLLNFALFNFTQNVHVAGHAWANPASRQVRLSDVRGQTDLNDMRRDHVIKLEPLAETVAQIDAWGGHVVLNISELIAGPAGLSVLNGTAQFTDGLLKLAQMGKPLEGCEASFHFDESLVEISSASCQMGKGQIRSTVKIADYLQKGSLEAKMQAEGLDLQEIIPANRVPLKLAGIVNAQADIHAATVDPAAITQALKGTATLQVSEGRILDINVLRLFLKGLSMIPNLMEKISEKLPEEYDEILAREDTVLKKVDFAANIQSGKANLTSADILADGFSFNAGGYYDFSGELLINGGLAMLEDLSAGMINAVPELTPLLNENGRIYMPMATYRGPAGEFKPLPDVAYLAKKIVVGRGRQELQNLIDKALGGEEAQQPGTEGQSPQRPEKEIINNILDNIFGE